MSNDKKGKTVHKARVLRFERDSEFFAKRADSKRMQNDPVSAAKLYWAALEKQPDDYDVRLALADVLSDMQRFTDSNHVLIPYMHEDGYFIKEAYCRVGFNYFAMGEYEAARHCFDNFFELTDEVSERTDVILDALDAMDSMMESANTLTDAADDQLSRDINAAHQFMNNSEFDKAMDIIGRLHDEHPDDKRIKYDYALACMCSKEHSKGLALIDELLDENAEDISALSLKLVFAQSINDEVMIGSICNRIAKCEPDLPDELVPVIGIILDIGRGELALSLAKRVYKRSPFDNISNHIMALCYIKLKQYNIAAKFYDRLLSINRNDSIARFYLAKCLEHPEEFAHVRMDSIAHYQIPLTDMLQNIKLISGINMDDELELKLKWRNDASFRNIVRWALTLKEFSICYGMMGVLKLIGDDDAQRLMREAIIDPDTNPTLAHEALGMLKSIHAPEPYFAFIRGSLLEGRVNMVDLSANKVPKQYMMIYPRFNGLAAGLYDFEVYAAASGILEAYFASLGEEFPALDEQRSTALSAALEYAACRRCGVEVKDDILERYGVTERRLYNAFNKLISAMLSQMPVDEEH